MITGIGIDLTEIERIRAAIARHGNRFLDRLFTLKEQQYALSHRDPVPTFAGRFAAKEAIAKALGVGIGAELAWTDIEILNIATGKPEVQLSENVQATFGRPQLLISISHSKTHATAIAIWQR